MAIIKTGGNHVYVLPLDGSPVRDLTVAGWSGFQTFDWSIDGKGFFIGNKRGDGLDSTLLFVDLNGKPHPLWQQKSPPFTWRVNLLRTAGIWPLLERSSVAICG